VSLAVLFDLEFAARFRQGETRDAVELFLRRAIAERTAALYGSLVG
jgi:hypothetical protein